MTSSPIKALDSDVAGAVAPEGICRRKVLEIHLANKQTNEKTMSQKELTRKITEPVELQAKHEKCATAADSHLNIAPAEQSKKQELFQKLKESEADLKKWNKSIRDKLPEFESLLRQKEAENEDLLAKIHTLEENKKILTEKNKSLTVKLAHIRSFIEKKPEEIRNLKQSINKLRADDSVYEREDQVTLLTEKLEAEIETLQVELHDFQEREQFLIDQSSHVVAELTEVDSQRDKLKKKSLELTEAVQALKNQMLEAEFQITKNEDEIKQLNRITAGKQDQIDDLNVDREIKSQITHDLKERLGLLQEGKILAYSEEMMNPVEETPPNRRSWFPSGKCLLKVGLGVAVEAEIKALQTELHNLEKREEFLLDQNSHVVAELTKVESQRDKLKKKSLELTEAIQDLRNQREAFEFQIMKSEDEIKNLIKKLNRTTADKQTDNLNKDREIKSQINQDIQDLQEENILADSEEMVNPVEETPPNSGSWFPSGKSLLKVCLGVAVGGLVISSTWRAMSTR